MGKHRTLERLGIYKGHILSRKEVESVAVVALCLYCNILIALAEGYNRFKHHAAAVLNELTH